MDKADPSTHPDTIQAGSDSSTSSPFNGHDLLLQPAPIRAAAGSDTADQHLPALTMAEFKDRAENFIAGQFRDNGSYFNRADLARLVTDPNIKGEDAVTLATLYALSINPKTPSDAHTLQPWGISSVKDIAGVPDNIQDANKNAFDQLLLGAATNSTFFNKAGANKDGVLSAEEIKKNPTYARVLKEMPDLAPPGQGLTLNTLRGALLKTNAQYQMAFTAGSQIFKAQQHLDGSTTRSLYADQANPLESIKMDDIHQGETGDCYFLAGLADAAKQDPAIIRDAIKSNPDGTYTVTFKGDPQHPVTVFAPTDTELALYNGGSADGLWPAVMEKAFASYGQTFERRYSDITNEDAISGGSTAAVLQLLTGHTVDALRYQGAPGDKTPGAAPPKPTDYAEPASQTAEMISQALAGGRLVALEVGNGDDPVPAGLTAQHAYSIIGTEPGANGGNTLLLNPWASGGIDGKGTIRISLASLSKLPVSIDVESNQVASQLPVMQRLNTGDALPM